MKVTEVILAQTHDFLRSKQWIQKLPMIMKYEMKCRRERDSWIWKYLNLEGKWNQDCLKKTLWCHWLKVMFSLGESSNIDCSWINCKFPKILYKCLLKWITSSKWIFYILNFGMSTLNIKMCVVGAQLKNDNLSDILCSWFSVNMFFSKLLVILNYFAGADNLRIHTDEKFLDHFSQIQFHYRNAGSLLINRLIV